MPLVLRANSEVRLERRRMLVLIERIRAKSADEDLPPSEQAFLTKLAAEYGVPERDFTELRQRVDVVPASLALAQGAEESGWGTSRFARLGNAVFGQRTFRKGDGLVPLRREQGQRYEVKSFNNLYKSVDYPDYAKRVAKNVLFKKSNVGILVCGSGTGMAMSANKFKKIRAVVCYNKASTRLSRQHNNANIMALGARLTKKADAMKLVNIFLNTKFEGGRHLRRVKKV